VAEFRALTSIGTLRRIVRWEAEPDPVTAADRQAFRKEVFDGLRQPERQNPFYERWLAEVEFPQVKTVLAPPLPRFTFRGGSRSYTRMIVTCSVWR
jgi:hypothetical protein